MKNYYEILEVEPTATLEQIKAQYLLLIRAWNPDNFPNDDMKAKAEEKVRDINEAYSVLSDSTKRAQYDREQGMYELEKLILIDSELRMAGPKKNGGIKKMAEQEKMAGPYRHLSMQAESGYINEPDAKFKTKNNKRRSSKSEINKILATFGKKYFQISVAHPKYLTKRFVSPFLIQLFFEELDSDVKAKIRALIGENIGEHVFDTELKFGQLVKIKLYSPDIDFPEPITKKLNSSLNSMTFLGKPLDTCQPGEHKVVLSIQDTKTDIEYQSETFSVKVVDFAFDHVSRPLLSKVSAVILGIGSFAVFLLTFLEQIDKTVGLTSGTAAGVLALAVYAGFYHLYQRLRPSTP